MEANSAKDPVNTNHTESFMAAFRQRRKSKGLSLQDLADRLQVSLNTVWNWEHGKTQPRPAQYPQLAFHLGIEPLHLAEMIDRESVKR